jgi:hypothetical protein
LQLAKLLLINYYWCQVLHLSLCPGLPMIAKTYIQQNLF